MVKVYSGYKTREVLTANRTYYVRTDGSDSNDGLSDTAGGAFLTPQKGCDVIKTLDTGGYDVKLKINDGNYLAYGDITPIMPIGGGNYTIEGNTTNPENVRLLGMVVSGQKPLCKFIIDGLQFEKDVAEASALKVEGSNMYHGRIKYKSNGYVINVSGGSNLLKHTNASISIERPSTSNPLQCLAIVYGQSTLNLQEMSSCTFVGDPSFVLGVWYAEGMGYINVGNVTMSGSKTGTEYNAVSTTNSVIRKPDYSYQAS
jgi:hypothetical protein